MKKILNKITIILVIAIVFAMLASWIFSLQESVNQTITCDVGSVKIENREMGGLSTKSYNVLCVTYIRDGNIEYFEETLECIGKIVLSEKSEITFDESYVSNGKYNSQKHFHVLSFQSISLTAEMHEKLLDSF